MRGTERNSPFKKRLVKQSAVCLVILLLAFGIKSIPAPAMEQLSQNIKDCLYYTVDYQATIQSIWNTITSFPQWLDQLTGDQTTNELTFTHQKAL
jgi:predicted PurR-regulated permease PerM